MRELGRNLTPLDDVREEILGLVPILGTRRCALADAHGRVLREDIVSRDMIPPFDNSAMDGYAVIAADLQDATRDAPVILRNLGDIPAGRVSDKLLTPGTTIRIMTGAPVPSGTEAVVPHELTEFGIGGDAAAADDAVKFFDPIPAGKNIRLAGGDLQPGDRPLEAGCRMTSPRLAIAATLGYGELTVTRDLRVAILSPGDELVAVDQIPGPGEIRNSNAYSLAGSLREAGATPIDLGIIPDDKPSIEAAISAAWDQGADALLSSGGVSAGDYDFIREVVSAKADPSFVFKVAMRPGKPLVFGLFGDRPFFGLPGNPAASIVSFEMFVRPALRKMQGESQFLPETFPLRFPFEYRYRKGRTFLLRTRVEPDFDAGSYRVVAPGSQDSSFLAGMAHANALVVLPPDEDIVPAGAMRHAIWLGSSRP